MSVGEYLNSAILACVDGSLRGKEKLPSWSPKVGYETPSSRWIATFSSNYAPAVTFV